MQPASPLPPAPSTQDTQTSQVVQVNGGQSLTADNTANSTMMPVTKRSPKDYIFGKVIGEGSYSTVRITEHLIYYCITLANDIGHTNTR
jgi:3-phosphoinositide dependent protein kinase-1